MGARASVAKARTNGTKATPARWDRLADAIRAHREELGYTQRSAADAAGLSWATWERVERGHPCTNKTLQAVTGLLSWDATEAHEMLYGDLGQDAMAKLERKLAEYDRRIRYLERRVEAAEAAAADRPRRR